MYGVTDANGIELEPGDPVRILVELWPDADPKRYLTTAKVDTLTPPDCIYVCFDLDATYDSYYDGELVLLK